MKRDGVNRFMCFFLHFISKFQCFSTKSTNNMKDKQLAHQKKLLGPNVTYLKKNKRENKHTIT